MSISEETRRALYQRAGGNCECKMKICSHHSPGIRCNRPLVEGSWEAHRIDSNGTYILSNLVAMCPPCHKNTPSYGRD